MNTIYQLLSTSLLMGDDETPSNLYAKWNREQVNYITTDADGTNHQYFKSTVHPQDLSDDERHRVLKYCLSQFDEDEIVNYNDLFLQGEFIEESDMPKEYSLSDENELPKPNRVMKTYETEDGHIKADCPICEGEEHIDFLMEHGHCGSCYQDYKKGIRKGDPTREDSIHLDCLKEIWGVSYKGVWYEVHVNATEERRIEQTHAEYGEVTEDVYNHLKEAISKIDNI